MNKEVKPQQFIKDRPIFIFSITCVVMALVNTVITFARLRSHDFKVPVQYVVHDGTVFQTANWYSLYSFVLFALLGAGFSIFLAIRLHKSNRLFAGGILITYLVVSLISFLVINSLLGLVSRV